MSNPDFIYDPDDWEYTHSWGDRDELVEDADLSPRQIKRFETLVKGPDKFLACVVTDRDENGEPAEWEDRWFDSEAEAKAACA